MPVLERFKGSNAVIQFPDARKFVAVVEDGRPSLVATPNPHEREMGWEDVLTMLENANPRNKAFWEDTKQRFAKHLEITGQAAEMCKTPGQDAPEVGPSTPTAGPNKPKF